MSIKATFPAGVNELTVHGLHQWDYGQKLEIHADDLPAMLEVHFACEGMRDAVVRSCALIDGVAEAAIPDQCLEQTSPVIAWVYLVGETSGATDKTIIMPIIARTQPQAGATVPEVIGDRYTEAVSAMNGLVNEFKEIVDNVAEEVKDEVREGFASGELIAPNAEHAQRANYAGFAVRLLHSYLHNVSCTIPMLGGADRIKIRFDLVTSRSGTYTSNAILETLLYPAGLHSYTGQLVTSSGTKQITLFRSYGLTNEGWEIYVLTDDGAEYSGFAALGESVVSDSVVDVSALL